MGHKKTDQYHTRAITAEEATTFMILCRKVKEDYMEWIRDAASGMIEFRKAIRS